MRSPIVGLIRRRRRLVAEHVGGRRGGRDRGVSKRVRGARGVRNSAVAEHVGLYVGGADALIAEHVLLNGGSAHITVAENVLRDRGLLLLEADPTHATNIDARATVGCAREGRPARPKAE